MIPTNEIDLVKASSSKINDVDFNNLQFGRIFTDHMLVCNYKDGKWQKPQIMPYQPMTLEPSARVLHYGQAIFEGMKAYKDDDGKIFMFRPDQNFARLNKSATRLAMPEFPKNYFINGLETLVKLETEWIKPGKGNSLYLRPFIVATCLLYTSPSPRD